MQVFLTDLMEFPFLQAALLAGILASIACGIVGSFVVVRRITYIAGGIAHCTFAGLGAARWLNTVHGWSWFQPIHGAFVAALLAAFLIGIAQLYGKEREDTVISAIWAVGMAVGVLFVAATPGYAEDLMSYLFGNVLMVSHSDLWLIAMLDVIIIFVVVIFYHPLVALCFDEEYLRLRGLRVEAYTFLLLALTAVTVVLLVSVVGIVLVIALLTLPVAIASRFCRTLWHIMLASILLSMTFTSTGLALSYSPNLPAGALTIVIAGISYLLVTVFTSLRSRGRKL